MSKHSDAIEQARQDLIAAWHLGEAWAIVLAEDRLIKAAKAEAWDEGLWVGLAGQPDDHGLNPYEEGS